MPVCIAGMPHSGMPLVSRLLSGIGLDLGPIGEELPSSDHEGRFTQLNDEILRSIDAAWNSPPRGGDWVKASELEPLRLRAVELAGALGLSEPWGWADPRNSLTLPFWRELFPELRLLVCVRNPREVAGSLGADEVISSKQALSLWEEYYDALLDLGGDTSVVTHYDSFRTDPQAELNRLARGLGLDSSRVEIAWTAGALELPTDGTEATDGPPPGRLQDLHDRLLEMAKEPLPEASPAPSAPRQGDLPEPLSTQRLELEHVRLELARARGHIEALRAQVAVQSEEPAQLREIAINLEQQLVERDEELEELRKALREGDAWRREVEATTRQAEEARREAEREVEALREELELIKSTRLWSTGQRYWALKERLRKTLGRGSA